MIGLSGGRLRLASAADETLWWILQVLETLRAGRNSNFWPQPSDRLPRFSRTEPECGAIATYVANLCQAKAGWLNLW
jgi:hypothetical protein